MADNLNPKIVDSFQQAQNFAMGAVMQASAAGKAYHSVAHATACAIQDAADHLRNTSTIAGTAIGVALAEWMETGDRESFDEVFEVATKTVTSATESFSAVGSAAAAILRSYPSGS